jgi:hypothetical protein
VALIDEAWAVNDDRKMSWDELEWLINRFDELLEEGGNSLEIGAYKGMLTYICTAIAKKKGGFHTVVDAFDIPIDTAEAMTHIYGEHTEQSMRDSLGELSSNLITIRSKSCDWEASHQVINGSFDYCFIDGDHRDPIVYMELCQCKHSVKHILGHDYGWPGVTASVDRFMKENGFTIFQPLSGRGVFELIKK